MVDFDTISGRFVTGSAEGVDGRVKPGHDLVGESRGCRHAPALMDEATMAAVEAFLVE